MRDIAVAMAELTQIKPCLTASELDRIREVVAELQKSVRFKMMIEEFYAEVGDEMYLFQMEQLDEEIGELLMHIANILEKKDV
jgi:hypothetical protein